MTATRVPPCLHASPAAARERRRSSRAAATPSAAPQSTWRPRWSAARATAPAWTGGRAASCSLRCSRARRRVETVGQLLTGSESPSPCCQRAAPGVGRGRLHTCAASTWPANYRRPTRVVAVPPPHMRQAHHMHHHDACGVSLHIRAAQARRRTWSATRQCESSRTSCAAGCPRTPGRRRQQRQNNVAVSRRCHWVATARVD